MGIASIESGFEVDLVSTKHMKTRNCKENWKKYRLNTIQYIFDYNSPWREQN